MPMENNKKTALDYAIASVETMMRKFEAKDLPPVQRFHYHQGVFLTGVKNTAKLISNQNIKEKYEQYIKEWVDSCIGEDGWFVNCDLGQFDDMEPGVHLFDLYKKTGNSLYESLLDRLIEAVMVYKRIPSGGFYHKDRYPNQMWLDGLYMAGPLCCQYAKEFNKPELFDETYHQITLMKKYTEDEKTGLWYHAYDDSRQASWADKETGKSPEFWGRSIGWVPMAILDDLKYIPNDYEHRQEIIDILVDLIKAICKFQSESGMWYQVVDKADKKENWPENSCTCLYTAAICQAVKLGYLPEEYLEIAKKGYEAVIRSLTFEGEDLLIGNICVGTGVGDYTHYINRPTSTNDLHGVGAFLIMCSSVYEVLDDSF